MEGLKESALVAVRDCMGIKEGETFLVITDEPLRKIGFALWEAGTKIGAESLFVEIIPRKDHGEDPPPPIADLMKQVDAVLCPTSKSLTHTTARREACAAGARVATMPGITEEIMARTLSADYHAIAKHTIRVAEVLTKGASVKLTSPSGTDIELSIEGRDGIASTGLILERGAFGNLPSGEGYLAPVEGSSNGIIVFDGSVSGVGILKNPIRIEVKDGFAVKIDGGDEAGKLEALLKPHGKNAYNIAELGIGTNGAAIITGVVLEDEKVAGTVHIALGNNASMGGAITVPIHLDGLIIKPTLAIDGKEIMKDGKLLV